MARAIWTGSLSFGLVNVPVGLYSATEGHEVHFRQFEEGTSSRIRYRRVNEDTGEEVDYSDIVKGAEVGDGQYVIVTRYTERVEQLIEAKLDNEEVVTESQPGPSGQVVDLMQALQASLDSAKKHKPGNRDATPALRTRASLEELSKTELYDLARELDVPGRSKMTRAQLARAVAGAQQEAS